ncbi:MAG: ATP-binding protein [Chloroflexi bacterium]|nr:ATP-binding protein [Chloroflexota bacterium]
MTTPRLLDEWQAEPDLWNYVRHAVDDRAAKAQFILTGSAVPAPDARRHPGSGRSIRLRMRPMTLAEVGHSSGAVSLARVLAGERVAAPDPGLTVRDIAERIVVGGWPGNLRSTPRESLDVLQGYLADLCDDDIQRLDDRSRDPEGVRRLLASLARNVGTPASINTLTRDANGEDRGYQSQTIGGYLRALERLMVTDDVPAWQPSIRSSTRLRSMPVRYLADPSLATAALNADPARVITEIEWMGFLFESMVMRDLRVMAEARRARVLHYRDENGLEVDAIVELPDGRWAGFEVKLGSDPRVVDAAAAALLRLRDKVAGEPPIALGVITGTGYGFTRPDGVHKIPIGALVP